MTPGVFFFFFFVSFLGGFPVGRVVVARLCDSFVGGDEEVAVVAESLFPELEIASIAVDEGIGALGSGATSFVVGTSPPSSVSETDSTSESFCLLGARSIVEGLPPFNCSAASESYPWSLSDSSLADAWRRASRSPVIVVFWELARAEKLKGFDALNSGTA